MPFYNIIIEKIGGDILKTLRRALTYLSIALWATVIAVFITLAIRHKLINYMPIIAYNRPQNYVGWLVVLALIYTVVSAFLRLFETKK